jgi:Flp pilus assembly protein TadB
VSYGLKLGAAAMGFLIVAVLAAVLFNGIWFKVGFGAAFAILCAVLLFIAWRVDKKEKDARAGLEDLPNV